MVFITAMLAAILMTQLSGGAQGYVVVFCLAVVMELINLLIMAALARKNEKRMQELYADRLAAFKSRDEEGRQREREQMRIIAQYRKFLKGQRVNVEEIEKG